MFLPGILPDLALGLIAPVFVKGFTVIIIRFGVNIEIFKSSIPELGITELEIENHRKITFNTFLSQKDDLQYFISSFTQHLEALLKN